MGRERLLIRGCHAADTRGARQGCVDIFLDAGAIADISPSDPNRPTPRGWSELEAVGTTVVPGLINMHDHLGLAHPGTTEEVEVAGESAEHRLLRLAENASKALAVGVTGVRLMGERNGADTLVREAVEAGMIDGPRIWTAAEPLDYVGGGRDFVGAVECDSVEEYVRVAIRQLDRGADFLKLMMSGGGASNSPERIGVSVDAFLGIRAVAREAGVKIALHTAAVPHPIIDMVLADGVDSLEHCYLVSADLIERCVERGILLVMTPLVSRSSGYLRAIGVPESAIESMDRTGTTHWDGVRAAVRAKARLALGTDFHSHLRLDGTSAPVRELEMYEEAGADPAMLLDIASRSGAVWLGTADRSGLVETGFDADLLVLEQNPFTKGAAAFREIRHVIARGRVIEPCAAQGPVGSNTPPDAR